MGNRTRAKIVKNKVAPPFRTAEFDLMFGSGISREGDLLDIAADMEIIQKSGSWFSYQGERLGQGRENVKEYIRKKPEFFNQIDQQVRAAVLHKKADLNSDLA